MPRGSQSLSLLHSSQPIIETGDSNLTVRTAARLSSPTFAAAFLSRAASAFSFTYFLGGIVTAVLPLQALQAGDYLGGV